ncbi:MAG: FAD-binding oxidoreductase [Chloroflexi bacterium]|nr:FAD-binding oxidoreductase [Chloroflexota bacterium]
MVRPGDESYDHARRHYNALIDKRPALIVQCAGVADVLDAVRFSRTHDVLVAVRGGGHNVAGRALLDGGMVIDLSPMKGIRVDPGRRTVRAEGGVTWGEFDRETQAFGMATTGGLVSSTGIAGFTLGGGLGWLMRRYGLACDNLLSVDLVTADGRFLTVSAEEHPNLFWGMRGAGPNFGIATALEYRLYPVGPVLAGRLVYPFARTREVFEVFREFTRAAPDELTSTLGLRTGPDGELVVGIFVCYSGPIVAGEKLLQPLRQYGRPLIDGVRPMAYREVQMLNDPLYPSGVCHYWKSNFLQGLDGDAIDTIIDHVSAVSSPLTGVVIEHLGGAVARVGPDETAFGHRQAAYDLLITSLWTDPTESERHIQWTRQFWEAMQPFSTGGTYVNYLDAGRPADAAYDAAIYQRLVALKRTYDPTNFFRLNVNVRPDVPPRTAAGPRTRQN